jgi:putative ABC transport system permease protein
MLLGIGHIRGQPERVGAALALADRYMVSPSYFATMGIRLLRGRVLSDADRADGVAVCVIDEVFARLTFGAQEPIGQEMQIAGRDEFARIVGVVSHVKTLGLDAESPGQIYVSNAQYPWRWASVIVRSTADPSLLTTAVKRSVHDLDPNQPVTNVASMNALMADMLRGRRFTLTLLSTFAAVAMTLASIGLYGVIAFGVTQRRREFGVRLALGAQRRQIARMVLVEGGQIALVGAVIGAIGALAVSRFVSSLLYEVGARDATVFGLVSVGLVGVAMLACAIPAHRATTVNAAEVLRGD